MYCIALGHCLIQDTLIHSVDSHDIKACHEIQNMLYLIKTFTLLCSVYVLAPLETVEGRFTFHKKSLELMKCLRVLLWIHLYRPLFSGAPVSLKDYVLRNKHICLKCIGWWWWLLLFILRDIVIIISDNYNIII